MYQCRRSLWGRVELLDQEAKVHASISELCLQWVDGFAPASNLVLGFRDTSRVPTDRATIGVDGKGTSHSSRKCCKPLECPP